MDSLVDSFASPQTAARPRSHWRQTRTAIAALMLFACASQGRALAQQKQTPALPPAVLLNTAGAQAGGGAALDPVIQTALEDLEVVNIVSRPGMDLGAVQLVIDCVAETPECLRAVTTQQSADVLIAPSLARTSGELVLSFLRFDARGKGEMKRVTHRQPGQTLTSATLDAVPDLLRELFELPPKPKPPVVAAAPTTPDETSLEPLPEAPMEPPAANGGPPVGPILLGVGGALVIGTAAVLGASVNGSRDDYDHLTMKPDKTWSDIDDAERKMDSGKTRATIANVLFGVGGAALLGAGIWLAVELATRPDRAYVEDSGSAKLSPMVGPHQLGLVLTQRGEGL
jgi:hypothetical protein